MDNHTVEILNEGVLNDDMMLIAHEGYKFKGGYEAIVEYWTYQSEWSNKQNIKKFKTLENAEKFITKMKLRG